MNAVRKTLVALAVPLALTACASHSSKTAPATQPVAEIPTIDIAQTASAPLLASNSPEAAVPATQPSDESSNDIMALIKSRQQPAASQLPPGHPPMPQPQLPSGHPDISKMQPPSKATTQQSLVMGSLSIQAVQSTPKGPAVGGIPATVELYQSDKLFDRMESKLDATGRLVLNRIPAGMTPVVRVNYNGAEYEAAGEMMDADHAKQELKVPVYESTDKEPAWQIHMQHLIVQPTTDGVQVMEMLAVENPSDHAWTGVASADGKRTTIAFPLPANAKDIQLSGAFHEGSARIEAGRVSDSLALIPGTTQYRITYTVPVTSGTADFAISTPAAVQHMMLFVPDDGTTVKADGLQSGGVVNMGNGKTRFFQGTSLKAGAQIKLAISGITMSAEQAQAHADTQAGSSIPSEETQVAPAQASQLPKLVAGIGGLLIFVVGGFFLFVKPAKPASKKAK